MNKGRNAIVRTRCSEIRALARQALQGLWRKAIVAYFIYALCLLGPRIVLREVLQAQEIGGLMWIPIWLYHLLINGALGLGLTIFFINLSRSREIKYSQLFSGFRYYFKAIAISLARLMIIIVWSLVFIVPGIIAAIQYSQAVYLLADDPEKSVFQCLRESKKLMDGNMEKYILLNLSFLGWYALSVIASLFLVNLIGLFSLDYSAYYLFIQTAGIIGASAVYPYVMTANAVFYDILNGQRKTEFWDGESEGSNEYRETEYLMSPLLVRLFIIAGMLIVAVLFINVIAAHFIGIKIAVTISLIILCIAVIYGLASLFSGKKGNYNGIKYLSFGWEEYEFESDDPMDLPTLRHLKEWAAGTSVSIRYFADEEIDYGNILMSVISYESREQAEAGLTAYEDYIKAAAIPETLQTNTVDLNDYDYKENTYLYENSETAGTYYVEELTIIRQSDIIILAYNGIKDAEEQDAITNVGLETFDQLLNSLEI